MSSRGRCGKNPSGLVITAAWFALVQFTRDGALVLAPRKPVQAPRVVARRLKHCVEVYLFHLGHLGSHVPYHVRHRCCAAKGLGYHVWCVGFQEQPVERDFRYRSPDVLCLFKRDAPRESNTQSLKLVQKRAQSLPARCPAVQMNRPSLRQTFLQVCNRICVRIAGVYHHGHIKLHREPQLEPENFSLAGQIIRCRRPRLEVVQTTLTHGHRPWVRKRAPQLPNVPPRGVHVKVLCVVRMHSE
mmetsp:Transcript_28306/g.70988  ORF Transcript_28306/g.70988 Transcript_28306/m.70988 type:complete len:243 (-) Transcript_28306:479-1207(-)